jgi:type II secretory pathway pseudopilin PulG
MNSQGQSLLEIVAVIGLIAIVILGLVKGLTISLKDVQFSKERSLAENYAREAAEWLVYQKESDWNHIGSHFGTYCLNQLSWENSGSCPANDFISGTNYQRQAVIENETPTPSAENPSPKPEAKLAVTVSWASPRGQEVFNLDLNFAQWK